MEATGEGTVHSYVVMHHPPFPAFDPPYVVGLIQLAEGVRQIRGTAANQIPGAERVLVTAGTGVPTSGPVLTGDR